MSAETMGMAIALSSPSGRMSKRARTTALARLSAMLATEAATRPPVPVDHAKIRATQVARLENRIKEMRHFVSSGWKPRAHEREAKRLEAELDALRAVP